MRCRLMVLAALGVVACRKPQAPPAAPPETGEPVVATFADHRITAADLRRYFDEQSPFVRSHYQSTEGKKAILGVMIQLQLLSDQALREGFDLDDEAVEQYRKAIITQWRRAKFDDAEGERSLSEPELRAYYDAHRAEYEKPQRARPGQAPTEGRTFEAAEADVRARLWEERKGKLYEDFVKNLTEQAHIKIDDDELAKVNRGSSEEAPQPASVVPRTSLDEQLRTTLPPYRESPADMTGPLVATFAGHKIPTAELKRYFEEQSPFVRAHYKSEESKKALLRDLIEAQLLVDEGLKGGFDQDPLAIEHFQRSMITEWMAAKFNETQGEQSLSEADLHAYYDAHLDDYQKPARVRVNMIFFKAGPAAQAEAEEAYRALSHNKDRTAFSSFAGTRSDDAASKKSRGDLGFRTHDELAKSYGEAVAAAADALAAPWDVSRVVRGTGGFYLLQLEERAPAFAPGFEASEPKLRTQLWAERRNKIFGDYLNGLMQQAQIKIDEGELARVKVQAPPEATADQGPAPALPTPWLASKKLRTPLTPTRDFPYTAQANLGGR